MTAIKQIVILCVIACVVGKINELVGGEPEIENHQDCAMYGYVFGPNNTPLVESGIMTMKQLVGAYNRLCDQCVLGFLTIPSNNLSSYGLVNKRDGVNIFVIRLLELCDTVSTFNNVVYKIRYETPEGFPMIESRRFEESAVVAKFLNVISNFEETPVMGIYGYYVDYYRTDSDRDPIELIGSIRNPTVVEFLSSISGGVHHNPPDTFDPINVNNFGQAGQPADESDEDLMSFLKVGFKTLTAMVQEQREYNKIMREKELREEEKEKFAPLTHAYETVVNKLDKAYVSSKEAIAGPLEYYFEGNALTYVSITPMQNASLQTMALQHRVIHIKCSAMPKVNNATYIGNQTMLDIYGNIKDSTRFVFHNDTLDEGIRTSLLSGSVKTGRVYRTFPQLILVTVHPCGYSGDSNTLDFCNEIGKSGGKLVGTTKEVYTKVHKEPAENQVAFAINSVDDLWYRVSSALMNEDVNEIYIKTSDRSISTEVERVKSGQVAYKGMTIDLTDVQLYVYLVDSWFKDTGFICPIITDDKVYGLYSGRSFIGNGAVDHNGVLITVAHVFIISGISIGSEIHVCHLGRSYSYELARIDMSKELAVAYARDVVAPSSLEFDFVDKADTASLHGMADGVSEFRTINLGSLVSSPVMKDRLCFITNFPAWQGMSGSPAILPKKNEYSRERVVAFHSYGSGISLGGSSIQAFLVPYIEPSKWSTISQDVAEWYDLGFLSKFKGLFNSFSWGSYHAPPRQHAREEFYATCMEWSIIVVIAIFARKWGYAYGFDSISAEIYTDERLATLAKASDAGVLGLPSALTYGIVGYVKSVWQFIVDHPIVIATMLGFWAFVESFSLFGGHHSAQDSYFYTIMSLLARELYVWAWIVFRTPHALCGQALSYQDIQTFAFIQMLMNIPVAWISASFGYNDGRMEHVRLKKESALKKDLMKTGVVNHKSGPVTQMLLLVSTACALVVGTRLFNVKGSHHSPTQHEEIKLAPFIALMVLVASAGAAAWAMKQTVIKTRFFGHKNEFIRMIKDLLPAALKVDGSVSVFILGNTVKFKKVLQSNCPKRLEKLIDLLDKVIMPKPKIVKGKKDEGDVAIPAEVSSLDVTRLVVAIKELLDRKVWDNEKENALCIRASTLFPNDKEIQDLARSNVRVADNKARQIIPVDVENDFIPQIVMCFTFFLLVQQTPVVKYDRVLIPIVIAAVLAVVTTPLKDWLVTFPLQQESDLASYLVRMATALQCTVITAPQGVDESDLSVMNWDKMENAAPYFTLYQILSYAVMSITFMLPLLYPSGSFNTESWEDLAEHAIIMSCAAVFVCSSFGLELLKRCQKALVKNEFDNRHVGIIPASIKLTSDLEEIPISRFRVSKLGKTQRKKVLLDSTGAPIKALNDAEGVKPEAKMVAPTKVETKEESPESKPSKEEVETVETEDEDQGSGVLVTTSMESSAD